MENSKAMLIYEYIRDCIQTHGVSPTVREICEAVDIKSTSTVHYYLQMLEERGLIVKDPMKKRTIKIPGAGAKTVPLVGTVTAGLPITAIEEVEDYIPVSNLSGDVRDYFALRVRGYSMKNAISSLRCWTTRRPSNGSSSIRIISACSRKTTISSRSSARRSRCSARSLR